MRYLIYSELFPSADSSAPRHTGIGEYCRDLAYGLAAAGRAVTVVTNREEAVGVGQSPPGLSVRRIGARSQSRASIPWRAAAVARAVRAAQPDLVVVGDPEAGRVFAVARHWTRRPFCIVFYGTEVNTYRSVLATNAGVVGAFRRRHLTGYVESAGERVFISQFTRKLLAECFNAAAGLILYPAVSDLFVTTRVTAPERSVRAMAGDRVLRFVTVGRISERKNQLGVLQVLAELRVTKGLEFQYCMVGNMDAAAHRWYFEELVNFVRHHRLERQVTFAQKLSDEEKLSRIDASDILIALSRTIGHSVEGFGISAVEGSARARPVIVSSEGGMPETVLDGTTGLVVPPNDRGAIAEAVMKLAANQALRRAMGEAGRRLVEQRFTSAVMARRFARHFEEEKRGAWT